MWLGKLDLILLRNKASGQLPTPTAPAAHTACRRQVGKMASAGLFLLCILSLSEHFPYVPLISQQHIYYTKIYYINLIMSKLVFHFKNLTIVIYVIDRHRHTHSDSHTRACTGAHTQSMLTRVHSI